MKSFEHVFHLHRLLKRSRYPVPFGRIQEELHCSRATVKRVLSFLRDYLGAPLETCREPRGYRYTDEAYELPGLWFRSDELHSLLALQQLLRSFQPGLLDDTLAPLRGRVDRILEAQGLTRGEVQRIRLLRTAARPVGSCFVAVVEATLTRKRLDVLYKSRSKGDVTRREVSPQRLVHYRDNWYLDAWCHRAAGVRTFSLDRVAEARILQARSRTIAEPLLDAQLGDSYGIFAGAPSRKAVLRFSPERARWVSEEQWHPHQEGRFLQDGRYELRLPYHRDEELILDILRYGPDVEVMAPPELRGKVGGRLTKAAAAYRSLRHGLRF